ncbi:MAG: hypothetical protein ABI876_05375, partial [Bacteroidota bacterium]
MAKNKTLGRGMANPFFSGTSKVEESPATVPADEPVATNIVVPSSTAPQIPTPTVRMKAKKLVTASVAAPAEKTASRVKWTALVRPDLLDQLKRAAEYGTHKGRRQTLVAILDRALRN